MVAGLCFPSALSVEQGKECGRAAVIAELKGWYLEQICGTVLAESADVGAEKIIYLMATRSAETEVTHIARGGQ